MKKIKTVIFDLDGTLLNTLEGITYYINSVFLDEGLSPIESSQTVSFVGDGARNLIVRACASRGVTDPERVDYILSEYKKRYDQNPYHLVKPYDDIETVIDELKSRGFKLAVLSNKPDFATALMAEHFFGGKFDIARGAVQEIPLKPSPDSAKMILDELESIPAECAFVGDGETDIQTAENLGAALPISVLWGFRTEEQLRAAGGKKFARTPIDLLKFFE